MDWLEFALAFAAFFLTHSLPLRPQVRHPAEARLGRRGFRLAYSLLSLAALVFLLVAAGRAPYVELWPWAPWQSHLTLLLMAAACLVFALAVGRPNPFSFGGGSDAGFDPARPGIVRLMRHPLLVALALWSIAHLVPNGNLAHVLVFGAFAGFALAGGRVIDRRKRREMGPAWEGLSTAVRKAPLLAWPARPGAMAVRAAAGLLLYAALLYLHPQVIGVDPLA